MDYEKKYKEALERAKEKRDEYKRLDGEKSFVPSDIEYIFPELSESEDEKTRKELIEALKQLDREKTPVDSYPYLEWVSWLEKQGEVKESLISQHDNKICKENDSLFPELTENEGERIRKTIIECVKNYGPSSANPILFRSMIAWLEKQGE